MRAAIYARYSTDLQSKASIEDQVRLCKDRIAREGWTLVQVFSDAAMSGASALRPGYQAMLNAVRDGSFDVVLAEALDRLTRDQEDIAALFKRLKFVGIQLVTLSEGTISQMNVGLNGLMNAMQLTELANKTRRGLRGRVETGKSAGGRAYGYAPVRKLDADGNALRGDLKIVEAEADVVRRIFTMFAAGHSPIAIARKLNADSISGPDGAAWLDTTIRGHAGRGTGVLRNELYVGRRVWNRQRYVKHPDTGKRVSRPNPPEAWIRDDVPELRIIDEATWNTVQNRLSAIREQSGADKPDRNRFWERKSAVHILTGKVFCGVCGGSFSAVGKDYLACTAARKQQTCTNRASVRRADLEQEILHGLEHQLMTPEHMAEFTTHFMAEWNRLAQAEAGDRVTIERELAAVNRKISGLIDAIADGLRAPDLQQKLDGLAKQRSELEAKFAAPSVPRPHLIGNLSDIYKQKVADLAGLLRDPEEGREALETIRGLIDKVEITTAPDGSTPEIVLTGELASMIRLGLGVDGAEQAKAARGVSRAAVGSDLFLRSVKVVAGTGFEPVTFRL